jgi:hypothetical protein
VFQNSVVFCFRYLLLYAGPGDDPELKAGAMAEDSRSKVVDWIPRQAIKRNILAAEHIHASMKNKYTYCDNS